MRTRRPKPHTATTRASYWLASLFRDGRDATPSMMMNRYLLLSLCRHTDPSSCHVVDDERRAMETTLGRLTFRNLLTCDSSAVLLCAIVQKHAIGKLSSAVDRYVIDATRAVATQHDAASEYKLYSARYLLHRLDRAPYSPPPVCELPHHPGPLLLAGEQDLRDVANRIAVLTEYGARAADIPHGLLTIIETLALHSLRKYNLALAGVLLRALSYAGAASGHGVQVARDFLLDHQRDDGSFGYLGPETAALAQRRPRLRPESVTLNATLVCLWTLAETSPSPFSLYRDLS